MVLVCLFTFASGWSQMKTIKETAQHNTSPKSYMLNSKPEKAGNTRITENTLQFTPKALPVFSPKSPLKAGILNDDGNPSYIEGKIDFTSKNLTTSEMVSLYLSEARTLMNIDQNNIQFLMSGKNTDDLGIQHVKLLQYYKNIPVFGCEVILHGENDAFDFLNGNYISRIPDINVVPDIEKQQAQFLITNDFSEWSEIDQKLRSFLPTDQVKGELVIYKNASGLFHLAYHFSVYPNLTERWEYFVDAHNGAIIEKYQSLCKFHGFGTGFFGKCNHALPEVVSETTTLGDGKATAVAKDLLNVNRTINTYEAGNSFYLIDASRDMFSNISSLPNDPSGVIWTIDAFNTSPAKSNFKYDHVLSTNNTWVNTPTGVSSHYNGGKAFEYYRIVHNRNSIDGQGGNIISFINVADDDGSSMGNAFWNGAAMFYGNGDSAFERLARGLDVAGHEMSHGVIQNTANLIYQGESGALNESFADIFGVMIDRDDWLIGEDVVKPAAFPSGALRSMSNPHNGAPTGNFAKGWQPKHYDERYKGNEDNGGVHINSGIPNHAFFLFATAVGKDKAERVFYRALTTYLTKSSRFMDARVAVVKAATDIHGANSTEVNAAKKAFSDVGIFGDNENDYETETPQNPGQEFVLFTDENNDGLFITNNAGQPVSFGNPLTTRSILSKPSISDDGTEIVYVGTDNKIYYININWNTNQKSETVLSNNPVWRNAVISKDGLKIAALLEDSDNFIYVFDFSGSTVTSAEFELYNPTFTSGVVTSDVKYADVMEFDITGEYIMYDAVNEILSTSGSKISYWDIGFVKVWNNTSKTFALGEVEKLFSALPKDVSVTNPTFSKNSPYIVAFDYIEEDVSYLLGANLETNDIVLVFENEVLNYPTYSPKDNQMKFDNVSGFEYRIGRVNLQSDKISPVANSAVVWLEGYHWATWFSNGKRVLTDNEEVLAQDKHMFLFPNPAYENITLQFENTGHQKGTIIVSSVTGAKVIEQATTLSDGKNEIIIPVQGMTNGSYFVKLIVENKIVDTRLVQIMNK
ncbi:MAG: M4 family metallopeptidase [Saprospiraceae bacterium]|nr:M4 family metallopeptidase [Saprospiraceae bacterium]